MEEKQLGGNGNPDLDTLFGINADTDAGEPSGGVSDEIVQQGRDFLQLSRFDRFRKFVVEPLQQVETEAVVWGLSVGKRLAENPAHALEDEEVGSLIFGPGLDYAKQQYGGGSLKAVELTKAIGRRLGTVDETNDHVIQGVDVLSREDVMKKKTDLEGVLDDGVRLNAMLLGMAEKEFAMAVMDGQTADESRQLYEAAFGAVSRSNVPRNELPDWFFADVMTVLRHVDLSSQAGIPFQAAVMDRLGHGEAILRTYEFDNLKLKDPSEMSAKDRFAALIIQAQAVEQVKGGLGKIEDSQVAREEKRLQRKSGAVRESVKDGRDLVLDLYKDNSRNTSLKDYGSGLSRLKQSIGGDYGTRVKVYRTNEAMHTPNEVVAMLEGVVSDTKLRDGLVGRIIEKPVNYTWDDRSFGFDFEVGKETDDKAQTDDKKESIQLQMDKAEIILPGDADELREVVEAEMMTEVRAAALGVVEALVELDLQREETEQSRKRLIQTALRVMGEGRAAAILRQKDDSEDGRLLQAELQSWAVDKANAPQPAHANQLVAQEKKQQFMGRMRWLGDLAKNADSEYAFAVEKHATIETEVEKDDRDDQASFRIETALQQVEALPQLYDSVDEALMLLEMAEELQPAELMAELQIALVDSKDETGKSIKAVKIEFQPNNIELLQGSVEELSSKPWNELTEDERRILARDQIHLDALKMAQSYLTDLGSNTGDGMVEEKKMIMGKKRVSARFPRLEGFQTVDKELVREDLSHSAPRLKTQWGTDKSLFKTLMPDLEGYKERLQGVVAQEGTRGDSSEVTGLRSVEDFTQKASQLLDDVEEKTEINIEMVVRALLGSTGKLYKELESRGWVAN